jgi:hypothetical protein
MEGLDSSWSIAIHLAYKYNLVFGEDFVFTYGPLGILHTRLPISINFFVYLLFDLYFLITAFFALKTIIKEHFSYGLIIFIFLSITTGMYESLDQWYFVFFLFNVFSFIKNPKKIFYAVQAVLLSTISFYFKESLGIISIFIFLICIGYVVVQKKIRVRIFLFILLSYFLLIAGLALLLHVNLKGYILKSFHIIDAYNDAMSRPLGDQYEIFLYIALFIILIISFWIFYRALSVLRKKETIKNLDELFIYSIVSLSAFVIFKAGFVRSNTHIYIFFKSISLIASFLYLYSPPNSERKIASVCCLLILALSSWSVNSIPGSYRPLERITSLSLFSIKLGEIKNYFNGLKNYNKEVAFFDTLTNAKNELKEIIGNHSVDIIPGEISKIYFNGLRYNPRPVIQSYSAYDGYLDSLNYRKYISANAPDFILFSLSSIDERFPFFDESKTKLAILNKYTVFDDIKGDLLLRKKTNSENLIRLKEQVTTVKLGEDIPVEKTNGIQFSKILIRYSFLGKLKRFFYHPPNLKITLILENGETESFRAITPILAGGVILNKFIDSEKEFQLLMLAGGRFNTNVKKIRFDLDSAGGFIDDLKMINTYYRFAQKSIPQQIEDSLSAFRLMKEDVRYKPVLVNPAFYEAENFHYGIGEFRAHSQFIRVNGWAFEERANNNSLHVKAVLKSENNMFELPGERQFREDLPVVFKRKDVENSGFISTVSKSHLPPGDYQLGIVITDPLTKKNRITYTGHHTLIQSQYNLKLAKSVHMESIRNDIEYGIEPIEEDADHIVIKGWAFVKNTDSKGSFTNLILKDEGTIYKINTDVIKRIDVVAHFKDSLVAYSGFYVAIPKRNLAKGIYQLGIEKIYSKERKQSIKFTDEKIKIGISDVFIPMPLSKMPVSDDFPSGIDFVKDEKNIISLSGWGLTSVKEIKNSVIKIILKGDKSYFISETELKSRPDVTAAFKTKLNLDNCGFSAKISKDNLPKGKYQIGIAIYEGEQSVTKYIDQFIIKE